RELQHLSAPAWSNNIRATVPGLPFPAKQKVAPRSLGAKAPFAVRRQNLECEGRFAPCCAKIYRQSGRQKPRQPPISARRKPAGSQLQYLPAYMPSLVTA